MPKYQSIATAPGNLTSDRRSPSLTSLSSYSSGDVDEGTPLVFTATPEGIQAPPKDHWRFVGMAFLYLGMSTMLPWNFLISVTSFWDYKFRNVSLDSSMDIGDSDPTPMQTAFPSYLAIASNVPGAMTTIAHSFWGQRVSVGTRIFWSLSILLSSFLFLLAVSIPSCDSWQARFLHLALILVVLTNVGVNTLQGAMFGVSGRFPAVYAGFVMTGQAMGGVLPAAAAIGLTSLDVEPRLLGPACFGAIVISIIAAMVLFARVNRNPFFLFYGEGKQSETSTVNHDDEVDHLSYVAIVQRSWIYLITGFVNYATSLCVFPAVTSLVESQTKSAWTERYFTPVASVLLFNLGDLGGRSAATLTRWPGRSRGGRYGLLAFTLMRIGIIPLVMFCNAAPVTRTSVVAFPSDSVFCTLVAILGLTNGYVGNLCMIHSPRRLKGNHGGQRELTSILTNSAIVLGIATGSALTCVVTSRDHVPVMIHSDAGFCALVAFLAFSTGYVGLTCLAEAPKMSPEDEPAAREATSLVLTALLVLGQASGSFTSFFVVDNL